MTKEEAILEARGMNNKKEYAILCAMVRFQTKLRRLTKKGKKLERVKS